MNHRLRRLAVCILLALVLVPSVAAADQRPTQILIGASFVQMRFDEPAGLDVGWRNSLTLGADFGVKLFPQDSPLQLRGTLFLVPRGGSIGTDPAKQRLKFLYADLGVLLDWELKPAIGKSEIHLLFGPSLAIRATASGAMNGQPLDLSGQIKRFDAGLAIGASFVLVPRRIAMEVLYVHGFLGLFENATNQATNSTLLVMFSPSMWR